MNEELSSFNLTQDEKILHNYIFSQNYHDSPKLSEQEQRYMFLGQRFFYSPQPTSYASLDDELKQEFEKKNPSIRKILNTTTVKDNSSFTNSSQLQPQQALRDSDNALEYLLKTLVTKLNSNEQQSLSLMENIVAMQLVMDYDRNKLQRNISEMWTQQQD